MENDIMNLHPQLFAYLYSVAKKADTIYPDLCKTSIQEFQARDVVKTTVKTRFSAYLLVLYPHYNNDEIMVIDFFAYENAEQPVMKMYMNERITTFEEENIYKYIRECVETIKTKSRYDVLKKK